MKITGRITEQIAIREHIGVENHNGEMVLRSVSFYKA